ncbi:MAG: uncharacterized protein QOF01_811 [Thermomicrobiales bacterium]|nr:uncharacterized protein [Thermomicrobiales bacterium]
MRTWSPGEHLVLREVRRGWVWSAKPVTMVRDSDDLIALYLAPGTHWKRARSPNGARVDAIDPVSDPWVLSDATWTDTGVLILCPPGAGHALLGFWDDNHGALRSWYLNLQEPLRRTPIGFDHLDQILDLVVSADRTTWSWKDEDEFAAAQARGLIDAETAAAIRAEGERALSLLLAGAPPYSREWETWVPDPDWTIPCLPARWDNTVEKATSPCWR